MKKICAVFAFMLLLITNLSAQGYKVGDVATDFKLKNVDGKTISLSDPQYKDSKGFVIIFTCNHCPYAIAYEDRIIDLNSRYATKGYPIIAINPNDPEVQPADSYEEMQKRAKEKGFVFPYLFDEGQKVYPEYGAKRTPHVFILEKTDKGNIVRYIGAIDDNYEDATAVQKHYIADVVDALLAGKGIEPSFTKAIGCTIKAKK